MSQFNGHAREATNCGPTSMAMIARGFGLRTSTNDFDLISELVMTAEVTGASAVSLGVMAEYLGLNWTRKPTVKAADIAQHLRKGGLVALGGDLKELPYSRDPNATVNHFVAVVGLTAEGKFIIHDPADPAAAARARRSAPPGQRPEARELSAKELEHFSRAASGEPTVLFLNAPSKARKELSLWDFMPSMASVRENVERRMARI